jgi:hypothetical protein
MKLPSQRLVTCLRSVDKQADILVRQNTQLAFPETGRTPLQDAAYKTGNIGHTLDTYLPLPAIT